MTEVGRIVIGALALMLACEPSTSTIPVRLLLPSDRSHLERTNNVRLELSPDGSGESVAVDGLDFALEVEIEPSSSPRQLGVYLARDETLLAWGQTPPVLFTALGELAVFAGPPQQLCRLSEHPVLDASLLGAAARGRGAVFLEAGGSTLFFDTTTFLEHWGAELDQVVAEPPPLHAGALVSDPLGGVMRFDWTEHLSGYRFDPADNQWIELSFDQPEAAEERPNAAFLSDAPAEHLLLFGGGERIDAASIALLPSSGGVLPVEALDEVELDGPRQGAVATWVTRSETDDDEVVLLSGGDDPNLPLVYVVPDGRAGGPAEAWTQQVCAQLDQGDDARAEDEIRVLCVGGMRNGVATADAFLTRIPAGANTAIAVAILADFLPTAMEDPIGFVDEGAFYAQGNGDLVGIARSDMGVTEIADDTLRNAGGAAVTLGNGATLLVGGVDPDGDAVDPWQVFTPGLSVR